ncbi:MAG: hypothetical protein K0Q72_5154 [Armatimonadetes bacterium]|jgi:hypothetical protein|nr:hypothetical protein [Armatimonadota bacterium]
MNQDVLHRLPKALAGQLSPEEQAELAHRLVLQDELAAQLRALPLEDEEPALLPTPDTGG